MTQEALAAIHEKGDFKASIALVLGSGLGKFVNALQNTVSISFSEIPGFPVSTVEGHSGRIIHGYLDDIPVLVNAGRVHFYEGYSIDQVVYPVHVLQALGAETIILTNAAGSIRKDYVPGDLMLITRLLNQTGRSLFPDGQEPQDIFLPAILDKVLETAKTVNIPLKTGSYAGLNGPSYETPAEIRFLRHKKADAVGMSTIHESMAAFQTGMKVVGISCLSNYAAGILDRALNHAEVMETGQRVQHEFSRLLKALIRSLAF